MAGGEFCGNATMCAAISYAIKNSLKVAKVKVFVLDMKETIDVEVELEESNIWKCSELIPFKPKVNYIDIDKYNNVPIVSLPGISHLILTKEEAINCGREHCESIIKKSCKELSLPALGFMYYDEKESRVTPLVYVKESDTLFWENSCASGTIAIGAYLAEKEKKQIDLNLIHPGGKIKVVADSRGKIVLEEKVKII